jgi:acyl-CoA thioesterase-1
MNSKPISIYLFGDSICYGQLVNAYQTWTTALVIALEEQPDLAGRILVQNKGINGNTTRLALERMHFDVSSLSPDFVMIQFGMNDCNYWATDNGLPRVSPKAFVANLEELVERALASGARHCFLNTNHPSLKGAFLHAMEKSYDQSNAEYNELIRAAHRNMLKNQLPVTLVDMELAWNTKLCDNAALSLDHLLLADGIHLSVSGHRLYAEVIVPLVTAVLRKEGL